MKKLRITGRAQYQNLGTGFWSIIGDDGKEWRPVNMPEQLKYEGKQVKAVIVEADEDVSIFMWGSPVKVIAFETVAP